MNLIETFAAFYIIWNIIVFFIYGLDKAKAKYNRWRISENTLIICAFLMGGLGAVLGMEVFRHKTNHLKFKICAPLALTINLAMIFYLVYYGRIFEK